METYLRMNNSKTFLLLKQHYFINFCGCICENRLFPFLILCVEYINSIFQSVIMPAILVIGGGFKQETATLPQGVV